LKATKDKEFPSDSTFQRLGNKATLAKKLVDYCASSNGYDDVIGIFEPLVVQNEIVEDIEDETEYGFVYLMKSGTYYTIVKSNHAGCRKILGRSV